MDLGWDDMKIIDISLTTSSKMVTWPGDPGVTLEQVKKIVDGANSNVSMLEMGVHTGTHVDAPIHFLSNGTGIDRIPLDILIGLAQVIQIADKVDCITAEVIEHVGLMPGVERVIFKTRNSDIWRQDEVSFYTDFVAISSDGAQYLVDKKIKLIGIDYLSIAPYHRSRPTHEILLRAGVVIVEGLLLTDVQPGMYNLYCLPVKLGGSDGAPARAILIKN